MSALPVTTSLRKHPRLKTIFKDAEGRHLTDAELQEYCSVSPNLSDRAATAREVAKCEQSAVQAVVDDIFLYYAYEQNYQDGRAKCIRDIRYVSAYATLSMLMNDPRWFHDKLLIWLKRILQAFEFPERNLPKKKPLFISDADSNRQANLASKQRSIFETYTKLKHTYQEMLTPPAFELMESYLQQAIDILASD